MLMVGIFRWKAVVTLAVSACFGGACTAESPAEFAHRFCTEASGFEFRGIPTRRDESRYDHLVGIELIRAIRDANRSLSRWKTEHSGSDQNLMTPHLEENLFDGFSEGPTSFRVGRTIRDQGRWTIEVHREYSDGSETYQWVDFLILDRDSRGWVVRDIRDRHSDSLREKISSFRKSLGLSRIRPKMTDLRWSAGLTRYRSSQMTVDL